MKRYSLGYTQGTFDMFHIGHLHLIQRAKEQCEHLVVGVNDDALVQNYKHKTPVIEDSARAEIIGALSCVDEVRIVSTLDKMEIHRTIPYDAIFIGNDWANNERWVNTKIDLNAIGVDVVFLSYTEGVSSTLLRAKRDDRVEGI